MKFWTVLLQALATVLRIMIATRFTLLHSIPPLLILPPLLAALGKSLYLLNHYVNCDKYFDNHRNFLVSVSVVFEPTWFSAAASDPKRRRAVMKSEIDFLEQNGSLKLTPLPPGKRALGSKWVYMIKYKSDITIEIYKAQLVILENTQQEGVDFTKTFVLVEKMLTVRTLLSIAATRNRLVHQIDVHNVFFYNNLTEEVYMCLPRISSYSFSVCLLLEEVIIWPSTGVRCWFPKLAAALRTCGFL